MPVEVEFGAWDQETEKVDPASCCHNWMTAHASKEFVCLRCSTRKPMKSNIHTTAVIGGNAQWRGKETEYPVEIDPTAIVGPLTQIDAGCERRTVVGANTHVQGMVHVGHGVQIGRGCDITTGTVLAGEVTIGDFVRIGIGALVSPYVTVNEGARIGAGAVVINDVPSYTVVAGNPAKELRRLKPEELRWVLERMQEASDL